MAEQICGIYCIENIINRKKYIGQSADIFKRWICHKSELNNNCHYNNYLQKSWNKYGENNFNFSILEKCLPEELDDKEIKWIKYYNTFNGIGYNLTEGGGGRQGYTLSEETKQAISKSNKGKTLTEEHKRNIGIARRKSEKVARGENSLLHPNNRTEEFKKRMLEKYREYLSSPHFSPTNTKSVICITTRACSH